MPQFLRDHKDTNLRKNQAPGYREHPQDYYLPSTLPFHYYSIDTQITPIACKIISRELVSGMSIKYPFILFSSSTNSVSISKA